MRRLIWCFFLFFLAISAVTSRALAQADAQQAYQEAKAAYQAGEFAEARDKALRASQTDPENAEVFLLLGQAHYQLGELDKAIAAWQRTLKLAPDEPYAKRMLDVLRAERVEVDTRIELVEALARERLFDAATRECHQMLAEEAITAGQRARIMLMQADVHLRQGKPVLGAREMLYRLRVQYPDDADAVELSLLSGRVRLRSGGGSTAEGVAELKAIVADHAGTPAAATAQYELIAFDRQDGADAAWADAMAQWIADHPDHPLAYDARRELITGYLEVTTRSGKPAQDADLSPTDVKALALAAELFTAGLRVEEANQLIDQLVKHVQAYYADNRAHQAAVKATETLAAASLPATSRLPVLRALAQHKTSVLTDQLDEEARAGKLPQGVARGELPPAIAAVLAVYDTIDQEFPAQPTWGDRVGLAKRLRGYASKVLPLAEFQGLKGPDAWALDIVMPAVKANADAEAVKAAVELVQGIVNERRGVPKPGSQQLAMDISTELAEAVSPSHGSFSGVLTAHAQLLDARAKAQFHENLKEGRGEENAKLSAFQQQLLATLQKQVARDAAQAPAALQLLAGHLGPWVEHGHWAVAEEAYTALAQSLPEQERRQAELAGVGLWIQQVAKEHDRLMAIGLTVPRQLDPIHVEALKRCYTLQGEVAEEPGQLKTIRDLVDQIVAHYVGLEYWDVAEEAIQVKADEAVEPADEFAAFRLIGLRDEQARRELDRFLKQYNAVEKITLTPEFEEEIEAYKKFITDRPTSPLVAEAAERILAVGQLYQSHQAHELAAGIYRDFAQFAAGVNVLSTSAPAAPSTAERAAFAAAEATDAEARKQLARQMAERAGDAPPPEKISEEFAAAVAAYLAFVEAHGDSPLAAQAVGKVMAIALEYAKVDAWDVADGVYAGLLDSKLSIRRPERLEFCRALCRLGQAMPDHAREMLGALTEGGLRETREGADELLLARLSTSLTGRVPVGEMGGMGMGGAPGMPGAGAPTDRVAGPVGAASQPAPAAEPALAPAERPQPPPQADRDAQLLAMIRNQEASRAARVAQLREDAYRYAQVAVNVQAAQEQEVQQELQQLANQQQAVPAPVLSDAELSRLDRVLSSAYDLFQAIRKNYADTPTAEQSRGEILVMVGHWRSLAQWERAAELGKRFLDDNPTDAAKPQLRLEIARDWLAWASKPIERKPTRQAMLGEVSGRFERAREELAGIVNEFLKERPVREQAQWDAANSFLTQARVVNAFSPTLARGQYVRAAKELRRVAGAHPDHPQIGTIPQMLWTISQELEGRSYFEEAILVWNDLKIHYPLEDLAQQAALKIAQTYHQRLERPLRAAEAYQELNFARGGSDQELQNAIFQIGTELKNQKRWVEALHVLEMFVDSFPRHGQAGQALTMVGQIHQTNEAWEDAIAAYRRVIDEFENGQWVKDAKWAIAECTINLSRWHEASEAYRKYVEAYKDDKDKVTEANRRIEVLKDLARYQALVDEEGQRKAFDAQYQIATIVSSQLSNRVKAIIEYRKVVSDWPQSHLADDALHAVGSTYLALGETEKAREALLEVGEKYPASPLADDALFLVGKSYEEEADKLATVTRAQSIEQAKDIAQRFAYEQVQLGRRKQEQIRRENVDLLKKAGKADLAEAEEAFQAANTMLVNEANVRLFVQQAGQQALAWTATQLADRQDKINAALRKAVDAYTKTSKVAGADKADEALLQMATIYDQRLKDSQAAMTTWLEIVRQFSGTAVAEDASWRIAQTYERQQKYAEAVTAYEAFLRNYRRSPNAGQAQFAIAENYEHLGEWVKAMDSYTNYINNFPEGPLVNKARGQISWIKTYRL